MSIEVYNAKRRFDRTPEPPGKPGRKAGAAFVVQKHAARSLHYDFRLELDGVLKSWAVTKGPSLDPEEKRLAVHVEDHPIDYGEFEGIIPEGNYGAGTVILWDSGTWTPTGDARKAIKKGHLEFDLSGEKLKGRWHLVRMKGKPEEKRENWLLIKSDDAWARSGRGAAILKEAPLSVKSGKDIGEVARTPQAKWTDGAEVELRKNTTRNHRNRRAGTSNRPIEPRHIKGARKGALPRFVEPALAKLKQQPPKGGKWLHEIKFDGYRLQARIEKGEVSLLTRSGLDWTEKFGGTLAKAFGELPLDTALIDGELVVERDNGASDFSALQQDLSEGRIDRFTFYAFDLLYLDGMDLRGAALLDRKSLLQPLIDGRHSALRYSEHFSEAGGLVLEHACRLSLEGVISKDAGSKYLSGRKGQWIKSKCSERQEFVIGGYAPSSTSDQAVGSLALGVYDNRKLQHVGRVGTGFTVAIAEDLFKRLKPLERKTSPFTGTLPAVARRNLIYVAPELVAEVEFRAWSADGNLRHASFRGLRDDKQAGAVERESKASEERSMPQSSVKFNHPDRIYWPGDGVTKEGLAEYYAQVWKLMAPYVIDRPLALLRCPEGIDGPTFFQKHGWRGMNRHIEEMKDPKDKDGKALLRIVDFDGLMALVQSGVLEIHPWGATARALEKPDLITMDIDPGDGVPWAEIIKAAMDLKSRLENAGLAAFVKTSGGKGLHVVAPLKPKAGWARVKSFARKLAMDMAKEEPDRYLAVASKDKRQGRIFIDYLRNGRGNTAVAPYSTRARRGAPVSMPLEWSELTSEIGPGYFTVENAAVRLNTQKNDPWETFLSSAKPLPAG